MHEKIDLNTQEIIPSMKKLSLESKLEIDHEDRREGEREKGKGGGKEREGGEELILLNCLALMLSSISSSPERETQF